MIKTFLGYVRLLLSLDLFALAPRNERFCLDFHWRPYFFGLWVFTSDRLAWFIWRGKTKEKGGHFWLNLCLLELTSSESVLSFCFDKSRIYFWRFILFKQFSNSSSLGAWRFRLTRVRFWAEQVTDGLESRCCCFSKISYFLERIPMEHMGTKDSLDSKLQIYFTCSIRIRPRK